MSAIGIGTITVKALSGRTVVATGTAHAAHPGRVAVHLKFTKAAQRTFTHRRHVTLSLVIAQGAQHITGQLRLAR